MLNAALQLSEFAVSINSTEGYAIEHISLLFFNT